MGEAEWLAAGDPIPMLDFLGGGNPLRPECPAPPPSPRKLRLFAAACTLLLPRRTPGLRRAVEAALAFADGETGAPELEAARWDHPPGPWTVCNPDAGEAAYYVVRDYSLTGRRAEMAALLREVLGNPSRPAELRHLGNALCRRCNGAGTWPDIYPPAPCPACSCVTPAAQGIARRAYDDHDFAALPVLADALEEAGCEDSDILAHCRHATSSTLARPLHARGCWALDLVLGKS
jgi:hypothetical protein